MTPEITFRPAVAADAAFLYDVLHAAMHDHVVATWGRWDADAARQRRTDDLAAGRVRIVLVDGTAAGFTVVERHVDHVALDQIALLPAFQRRGIGERIVRGVIAGAGALPLRLGVLQVNPARRLYERLGFAVTHRTAERCFMERPSMTPAVAAFWASWPQAAARSADFHEAFYFEDNAADALALAQLVLAGRKRASAGLLWAYQHAGQPLPRAGQVSVVTDFAGAPLAIIETTRVDTVAFDEVSAEFAAVEGEGDGSLAFWRRAHDDYFGRECRRIGCTPGPRMPVVCERFTLVHS